MVEKCAKPHKYTRIYIGSYTCGCDTKVCKYMYVKLYIMCTSMARKHTGTERAHARMEVEDL